MVLRPLLNSGSIGIALLALAACASSTQREGFGEEKPAAPAPQDGEQPVTPGGDFGKEPAPKPPEGAGEVHEVYGHSATTLYKLEPKTAAVTEVGKFEGCEDVIDIALNEKSTIYAVSFKTLYTVDKNNAKCTTVASGADKDFPNSLSFVPKGTVDANEEALVGYVGADYVRIDTTTGAKTIIGKLSGGTGVESSGDIVSVKGGKTFLTVKGGSCNTNDCLFEVDPATGKKVHDWGSIEHKQVFGLSFWGGKVYGFDKPGNLFEVTFGSNKIVTTTIPIPSKPTGLEFWGAGSSTSAPLVSDPQ
jgi:hypothetical protein